jgi:hypothetical protein
MATIKLEQLTEFIKAKPGSTAKKVASAFGVSRKEVNSLLYAEKDRIFSKSENNHTWYLLGTKIIESSSSDEPAVTKITRKQVITEQVAFPGYSLFKVQNEHNAVRLTLNKNHVFFRQFSDEKDPQKMGEVVTLLETLASALEHQYTEIDFIEEFVNDWGYLLNRKLSNKAN